MKPLHTYPGDPAYCANAAAAYTAAAAADAAAYTAYAAAYAASASADADAYAADANAYGVVKDVGIKYAGILVQCQIVTSYKELF